MVDVGANIGGTVAQVSGPDLGGCICIEVDDSLFPILKENISGLPGVIAVRALCSDSEGNSEVVIRREDGSSTVSLCEGSCNSIPTVTVDGLLSEFADFGSPDLIKIDVEGYDYAVLKGTAKTMDKDRPALFFELYPEKLKAAGEDPLSISQFLMEHGYTAALVYDKYGIPLLALDIDDMGTLSGLVDYALLSIDYYDVLAVHSSMTAGLKEFAGLERVYFGLDGGS
jgi:FkbM family methyltransferase